MPVNSKHPQYQDHIEGWQDCRNFYEGETRIKRLGERYLPKPEDTTKKEYQNYVTRAGFFPAMYRTVAGLSGAIDRKAPTFELPPRIKHIEDDADSNNATLRQFSKTVLDENFITGRCGILCERDESGGKPYLVMYEAESIINWAEDGEQRLVLVVLEEHVFEQSQNDEFVQVKIKQYRVLRLQEGRYVQEIYRPEATPGKKEINYVRYGEPIVPLKAGVPLEDIPFVFCNVRSITTKIDKPPLLDLVLKNAEHYRVCADYANALFYTGNPILYTIGVKKKATPKTVVDGKLDPNEPDYKISIGSSRAIMLPAGAEIGLVECKGHGVSPNRDRSNDLKLEMAVLGARLLESQRTGVEAAETALLRQSGETSTLSNIVVNVSAAMKRALMFLDQWEGGDGSGVEFNLNDDFVDITMNPQLVSALADLVTKEFISWETFYYNLTIGELTIPGRSHEEERDAIEAQPPTSTPGNDLSGLGINPLMALKGANTAEGPEPGKPGDKETEEDDEDAKRQNKQS